MKLPKRLLVGYGVTDEIFSIASMEYDTLTFQYLLGLIIGPVVGWTTGTALGAIICSALPDSLSSAMGIALYGMFIAIFLPVAKKSRSVTIIVVLSVTVVCILRYVPFFQTISSGFRIIIATILGAGIGAFLFPIEDAKVNNDGHTQDHTLCHDEAPDE
jgi:predicted branched-subunit amino acid permease